MRHSLLHGAPMLSSVLERLDLLQSELAALDPSREIAVADRVAAMAAALREVAGVMRKRWDAVEKPAVTPRPEFVALSIR